MRDDGWASGPLDIATLEVIGRQATSHPLVDGWAFEPDAMSPRRLTISVDGSQFPDSVETVRIDVRWYVGGDYSIHYVERQGETDWQCRWDRHRKPGAPTAHIHPPPDASQAVVESPIEGDHHLDVLFSVLEWLDVRLRSLHEE